MPDDSTRMRAFVDNLEALSIAGVTRQFTQGPPPAVNATADLPATYVKLPAMDEAAIVFGEQDGWPTLRATLVVLIEPSAQNLPGVNFDNTVNMFDAVHDAMLTVSCGTLGKAKIRWTIRQGIETVAGTEYWALFVDVEGRG